MRQKKVWFITGVSKGSGFSLAKKLLAERFYLAATSRKKASLINAIGDKAGRFLPLEMDVTNHGNVKLNYAKRNYECQFITRKISNHEILSHLF